MKKRKLEEKLRQAELTIQSMRSRERNEREQQEREFEEALRELTVPMSVVTIISPNGSLIKAQVLNMTWEQAETDLSTFSQSSYVGGLRSAEIRLAPYPG